MEQQGIAHDLSHATRVLNDKVALGCDWRRFALPTLRLMGDAASFTRASIRCVRPSMEVRKHAGLAGSSVLQPAAAATVLA